MSFLRVLPTSRLNQELKYYLRIKEYKKAEKSFARKKTHCIPRPPDLCCGLQIAFPLLPPLQTFLQLSFR